MFSLNSVFALGSSRLLFMHDIVTYSLKDKKKKEKKKKLQDNLCWLIINVCL